ncbi:MAG: hypothetical protein A3D94_00300 [Alphaproteobacteria bacterium RIFCSPHIGHO2_12_FULL_66_14]|nr:MAG: hypothetical protein A3D94_00300 [Alphaproteobacteria bacterium RIFCSPHIGHO2_12_FULL_66_14]
MTAPGDTAVVTATRPRPIWKPSWVLAFGLVVFLFLIGTSNSRLLADSDTQWHIAIGRWILEHGAVPTVDSQSHTFLGKPWIAKEWLSQVALALVYRAAGWIGVIVLASGAIAVTFALLLRLLLHDLSTRAALTLTVAAFAMSAPHFLARPHVLAFPFVLLWTAGLVHAVEERRAPSWRLLPVLLAWANLHGGFTLGLALVAGFAIDAIVDAPSNTRRSTTLAWTTFILAAAFTACLTPYGPESIVVTLRILDLGEALPAIREWQPPDFRTQPVQELLLLGGLYGLVAIRLKVPLVRLLIVFGLLHLYLKHARNAELLATLAPLMLAPLLARQWPALGRTAPAQTAGPIANVIGILAAAFLGIGLARAAAPTPPANVLPGAALAFADQAGLTGHVFNDYDFGGALILRGIPTFIDGRGELYGGSFIKRYADAIQLRDGVQLDRMLDDYGIQWTLLRRNRPANHLLARLPGWTRVYGDDTVAIFRRQP